MMKHSSRIIRDGPEPDRTAVSTFLERQPETDVMPPVGALAVRLFERELFFFSLEIKRADRRIMVRPVPPHAANDGDAGAKRDGIGRKPACRLHRAQNIFLAADQS